MAESSDCIFCKLSNGEIPTDLVYQDELVAAFKDMNPLAPVHVLIVPKAHKTNVSEYSEMDEALLGHIVVTAAKLAKELGIEESGYRLVTNAGPDAGQTVMHTHFHLLGGKPMAFSL